MACMACTSEEPARWMLVRKPGSIVKNEPATMPESNAPAAEKSKSGGRSVSFAQAFRFWVKLGFISFGGPAGQIAIMHRELVDRRRWLGEERFLHALNYCMLLPGPEAQQLAIYIGWLLHRTPGGIVAGAFFVIPSVFILLALSYGYAAYGTLPAVAGVLAGFKPVVIAIVVEAILKIGSRALKGPAHFIIAAAAFVAIYFLHISFPLIVLGAALVGLGAAPLMPRLLTLTERKKKSRDGRDVAARAGRVDTMDPAVIIQDHGLPPAHTHPSGRRALRILGIGLLLWGAPFIALVCWLGRASLLVRDFRLLLH